MIILLRHQKTINNYSGFISGQSDSPILEKSLHVKNSDIAKHMDVIYSSPAQRCLDTLQHIQNLPIIPTIIDKRLLERNMGDFESRPRKQLFRQYPDLFRNINGKILFRFELTPPHGESFSDFSKRISSFCKEVIFANKERNILICSHNQTLKMMYFILLGIEPSEENWMQTSFPNGQCIPILPSQNLEGYFNF